MDSVDAANPSPGTEIVHFCEGVLGPIEVVADHSMPHGEARVLELVDRDDHHWIAKAARQRVHFARELAAYLTWVPPLGAGAPALRAASDELNVLVLDRLPGRPVEGSDRFFDRDAYRQAGRLIRRFHDSAPPLAGREFELGVAVRADSYVARASDLVRAEQVEFVRRAVDDLLAMTDLSIVPCHRDNHPRNWLIDEGGTVRLIDFGGAHHDLWTTDFARMEFRDWFGHPELEEAFFAGYGRRPTHIDRLALNRYGALDALATIVWARAHGDAPFETHGRAMLARLMAGR